MRIFTSCTVSVTYLARVKEVGPMDSKSTRLDLTRLGWQSCDESHNVDGNDGLKNQQSFC